MKKNLILLLIGLLLLFPCAYAQAKITYASDNVSFASLVLPYKDIHTKRRVINKMREQTKNLSDSEKSVIKKYVFGAVKGEDTYLLINCYLRETLQYYIPKKEITTPLKHRLKYYADCLSVPISKTKLPQNMILYRGIDEKGMKLIFKDKKIADIINKPVSEDNLNALRKNLIGEEFSEKGFMSTSYDINCVKKTKFIFEINAPKNLQAILIEDLGKKTEKEVLINKNTKWEVADLDIDSDKKTQRKFYRIKLKIIL